MSRPCVSCVTKGSGGSRRRRGLRGREAEGCGGGHWGHLGRPPEAVMSWDGEWRVMDSGGWVEVAEGTGTAGEGTACARRGQGWHGAWEELGGAESAGGGVLLGRWRPGRELGLCPTRRRRRGCRGPNAL